MNAAAFTVTSDGYRSDQPRRDPTQLLAGWSLAETLRTAAPGGWVDNKLLQVQHYKGVAYIAMQAVLSLHGGLTPTVGRKRRHRRMLKKPTTFLPGGIVTRALPLQERGSANHEEYDAVTGHPLNRLVERPNDQESFSELDAYLTLQYLLTGDGILWALPNRRGVPVELWALPTALTFPQQQRSPEYPEGAWRVTPYYTSGTMGFLPQGYAGAGAVIPGEEIRRFLNPDPLYKWNGKSPMGAGAYQVDILEQIDEARWAAFQHGVLMDAIIQLEGASDESCQRVEEKFTAKYGGSRNSRRIGVVSTPPGTNGKPLVQTLSNSPREMDFGSSHEQQAAVVCALWGVPSIVPGLKTAGSYSELYAAKQQLRESQRDTVRRKSEFYTKSLAWPYSKFPGEYRIQLDMPPLDDPDLLEKQLAQDADNGTITWNEYRRARNRSTKPDGDVPVPVYLARSEQANAADPNEPQTAGGQPDLAAAMAEAVGAEPDAAAGGDNQPLDENGLQDSVTAEALAALGVPADDAVMKAGGRFEESKHKRNHGKFSSTGGAGKSPAKPMGGNQQAAKDIAAVFAGAGKAASDNFYSGLAESVQKTGDVLPTDRKANSTVAQAWDRVKAAGFDKLPDAGERFARAAREAHNNGNDGKAWGAALNKHFAGAPPTGGAGGRHPSKHNPAVDYGNESDRNADDAHFDREIKRTSRAAEKVRGQLVAAEGRQKQAVATAEELKQRLAEATKKVEQARAAAAPKVAASAAKTPGGTDVLARAKQWAAVQADKHADRVAAHLGIDRESAKFLLRTTIEKLCEAALAGGSASQTYTGAGGKKLTLGVKRKGPTAGATPKPANPAGAGSLPPRPAVAKAMSAYEDTKGGTLCGAKRRRKRKTRAMAVVRKALQELGG